MAAAQGGLGQSWFVVELDTRPVLHILTADHHAAVATATTPRVQTGRTGHTTKGG